jgi:hypothetical protein
LDGLRKPNVTRAAPSEAFHATGGTATACAGGGAACAHEAPPSAEIMAGLTMASGAVMTTAPPLPAPALLRQLTMILWSHLLLQNP